MMKRLKLVLAASALGLGMAHNASAVPVDIAFVVDQSLSMGGEFNFIPGAITAIDTALQSEAIVTSTRYGLAGYMEGAGNEFTSPPSGGNNAEYVGLAFEDLTANVVTVSDAATAAGGDLRAFTERGYHAADWSRTGFSWDANAVKVMILLTDEAADQGSVIPDAGQGSDEANLGKLLSDDDFLLNVITPTSFWGQWDDAVFTKGSYQGLFDLNFLRDEPAAFTQQFVSAKVGEITGQVPNAPTLALLSLGLLGLRMVGRRAHG